MAPMVRGCFVLALQQRLRLVAPMSPRPLSLMTQHSKGPFPASVAWSDSAATQAQAALQALEEELGRPAWSVAPQELQQALPAAPEHVILFLSKAHSLGTAVKRVLSDVLNDAIWH